MTKTLLTLHIDNPKAFMFSLACLRSRIFNLRLSLLLLYINLLLLLSCINLLLLLPYINLFPFINLLPYISLLPYTMLLILHFNLSIQRCITCGTYFLIFIPFNFRHCCILNISKHF